MQKNPNDAWWSEDWEIDKGSEQMYAVLVFGVWVTVMEWGCMFVAETKRSHFWSLKMSCHNRRTELPPEPMQALVFPLLKGVCEN